MLEAPGAGLAAPQLGVGLRVFTYDVDDEIGHLINPVLDLSDEVQEGDEGCLSVPNLAFNTRRAMRVVAKGMNMHGEPVVIEGSPSCSPAACSTRPTTSTASCSSTGSTPRRARRPCARSARRSGSASRRPQVRLSPHRISARWL